MNSTVCVNNTVYTVYLALSNLSMSVCMSVCVHKLTGCVPVMSSEVCVTSTAAVTQSVGIRWLYSLTAQCAPSGKYFCHCSTQSICIERKEKAHKKGFFKLIIKS